MKFSAREDVGADTGAVFAAVTDFEGFERQALRRGIDVERRDGLTRPGVGMSWMIGFTYRGRRRAAETTLTAFEPGQRMEFLTKTSGLECHGEIDLIRLGKTKTRLHATLDIRPQNFRARMLLQAVRLAKASLTARFKSRVARYARQIERDHDA